MHNPFTTLFGQRWSSFTVLLMVAVILTLLWLMYRAPSGKRTARIDVFLASFLGGVIIGRMVHVITQWQYFVDRTSEIYQPKLQGGFNWHGIVIGAFIMLLIMSRLRKINVRNLLDDIALILPLLALFGWWACGTVACAYGLPVERMADYPRWATWLAPDIFGITEPRFATQLLGVGWAIVVFVVAAILHRKNWIQGGRIWIILALLSAGIFGIGFLRGDFALMHNDLRADQWLDLGMIGLVTIGLIFNYNIDGVPTANG